MKRDQADIKERLLCRTCDNQLGKHETTLARELRTLEKAIAGKRDPGSIECSLTSYHDISSALLSMLWRMSISAEPIFAEVDLGSRHNDRLRNGFRERRIFEPTEYPIITCAPLLNGIAGGRYIFNPYHNYHDGHHMYHCPLNGFVFSFFVTSAPINDAVRAMSIKPGRWPVIFKPVQEIMFMHSMLGTLLRA